MTMLERRRRSVQRAIASGLMVSIAAVVPLWLIELIYVMFGRQPVFDNPWQVGSFVSMQFFVPAVMAGLLGTLQGLVVLAVARLTPLFAQRRIAEPKWMAGLYCLMVSPLIAVASAQAFSGRRAQLIPGKDLIAVAVGVVLLAGAYAVFRLVIFGREQFRLRRWQRKQAYGLCALLFLGCVTLYLADQKILSGLYPFFHNALALGVFTFSQLTAATLYMAWRPQSRWLGRLMEPTVVPIVAIVVGIGGAWGLYRVNQSETLRYVIYQHTALQSKVVTLASQLGLVVPQPALTAASSVSEEDESTVQLPSGPRVSNADVLLISVDALRADHLGVYGYKQRSTSPHIDRWAKSATVVDRGYCPVPHTSFSLTSLLTGSYVAAGASSTAVPTLAKVLRRYGYKTGGFFPPAVFYIDKHRFSAYQTSMFDFEYVKYEFLDAHARVEQLKQFYAAHREQKTFAWVHFFEPHEPYDLHEGINFGPRAVDRYDAEIAYVDRAIGELIAYVQKQRPNTIVILTGDHGEAFGEHREFYHGSALYEEQIRVPLIFKVPSVAPQHIAGQGQSIDIAPTVLSMLDVPVPASMHGVDLGPWLAGADVSQMPSAFAQYEHKRAVVRWPYKLIFDESRQFSELYQLIDDPLEKKNIAGRNQTQLKHLRAQLGQFYARVSGRQGKDRRLSNVEVMTRAESGDQTVVPRLIDLLESRGIETRRESARLLTVLRSPAALAALIKSSKDPDPAVSMQSRIGAALLGHRAAISDVREILSRPDCPPHLQYQGFVALARHGDRNTVKKLISVLEASTDIYQRIELIRVLGELGDVAASDVLKKQLLELRTRRYALASLGQIRATDAVPEITQALLTDRFISWRQHAAAALGKIGGQPAVAALVKSAVQEVELEVVAQVLDALRTLNGLTLLPFRPISNFVCSDVSQDVLLLLERPHTAVDVYCGEKTLIGTWLPTDSNTKDEVGLPHPMAIVASTRGATGSLRVVTREDGRPAAISYLAVRPARK